MFDPGLNYNISSAPAGDCAHVLIVVHNSLQYSPLPVVTDLQAVALKVVLDSKITICSILFIFPLDRLLLMLTSNHCWVNFHHHFCFLVIIMHSTLYGVEIS